jgi:hypothetical protein
MELYTEGSDPVFMKYLLRYSRYEGFLLMVPLIFSLQPESEYLS